MCFVFPVKFVNLAVYLTTKTTRVPRVEAWPLRQFLGNVANEGQTRTWTPEGRAQLAAAAEKSLQLLGRSESNVLLEPARLAAITAPVRALFEKHMLFALPAGGEHGSLATHKLSAALHYMAAASGKHALVLIPDVYDDRWSRTIVDPMPAVELLCGYVEQWPGVLFWSSSGAAAFAGLEDVMPLYSRLETHFEGGLDAIDRILQTHRPRKRSRRLLHLSDLHFGTHAARRNLDYLREGLLAESHDVSRVVITGDLIDTPRDADDDDFAEFKEFRRWLSTQVGKDVIVVPGNHDQRWRGNRLGFLGDNKRAVADLAWHRAVADDDLMCSFLCLDSSRDGSSARGELSQAQLDDVAREFEALCAREPAAKAYRRVAVLHHHPRSYSQHDDLLVQPLIEGGILDQEALLGLVDAERFLAWCSRLEISVVLHGHKHLQRLRPGRASEPAIVGCGTSLGAENKPLSFNLLTVDPLTRRVSVAMYSDDGHQGGFRNLASSVVHLS